MAGTPRWVTFLKDCTPPAIATIFLVSMHDFLRVFTPIQESQRVRKLTRITLNAQKAIVEQDMRNNKAKYRNLASIKRVWEEFCAVHGYQQEDGMPCLPDTSHTLAFITFLEGKARNDRRRYNEHHFLRLYP